MYTWKALNDKLMPTVDEAKKALKRADAGDLKALDTRMMNAFLMQIVSANSDVKGSLRVRRTAVTSFDYNIVAKDTADAERAQKAFLRCKNAADAVRNHYTKHRIFGTMLLEFDWRTGKPNGTTPYILKRYLPTELEQVDEYHLNVYDDNSSSVKRTNQIDLQDSPADLLGLCDDGDRRGGELRSLAFTEILRWEMITEWANFNRKLKGIVQALYDPSADDADKAAATNALKSAVQHNYTVSSNLIDFKFHEIVKDTAGKSFAEMINKFDSYNRIALLGQANATELPNTGSHAALKILNLIRADISYDDITGADAAVNKLLLKDWQMNNGGETPDELPYECQTNIPEEADLMARAMALETINRFADMTADDVYNSLGITNPDTSVTIIKSKGGF